MKRFKLVVVLMILAVLTAGCGAPNGNKNPIETPKASLQPTETPLSVEDYVAYKENTRYVYEGTGNEYAFYSVYVDYKTDDRVQIRTNNGGTESVKVMEYADDAAILLFSKGECYYREDFTQNEGSQPEVLLKGPLTVGTTWTLAGNKKRTITNLTADITTPSGSYKAVEVATEGQNFKEYSYYAPKVGLVKTVYQSEGTEVTSSLSEMVENTPLVQNAKIYYPNDNTSGLRVQSRQLSFYTNDRVQTVMENEARKLLSEIYQEQPDIDIRLNNLYFNDRENVAYIDFSKELTENLKVGSGFETQILQSITNTLAAYYNTDRVCITVDGGPYSSGHYLMKKGETFKADYSHVKEVE